MKKVLALVLMASVVQGSLLASWEHDEINKSRGYYALNAPGTRKYYKIRESSDKNHDLRSACEFAPRGWFGKNTVETACDILYKQFDTIDELVEKACKNNQSADLLTVTRNDKFIKKEDAQDLIKIILNVSKDMYLPTNDTIVREAWDRLNDDYKRHHEDALRKIKVSELSQKYPN